MKHFFRLSDLKLMAGVFSRCAEFRVFIHTDMVPDVLDFPHFYSASENPREDHYVGMIGYHGVTYTVYSSKFMSSAEEDGNVVYPVVLIPAARYAVPLVDYFSVNYL